MRGCPTLPSLFLKDQFGIPQKIDNFSYCRDFSNLDIVPKDTAWQNYLNYGWLDQLKDKPKKYVFSELLKNVKFNGEASHELYSVVYKYCCKFSHGNYLNQSIDPYVFIWILSRTGIMLMDLAQEFSKMFNMKFEYNNIDLLDFLDKTIIEAFNIYEKQSKPQ